MEINKSRTKIIATIGPASSDKKVLKQMFQAGVDVCRLNLSHGTHKEHVDIIQKIRQINSELGTNIAILADLQGPKIRIGEVENNKISLKNNDEVTFITDKCIGTSKKISISYEKFPKDVKKDDFILIDDGKIKLQIISTNEQDTVLAKVINGGDISSKKGVNLPSTEISLPSLTEKDIEDAHFALENDVNWLALSFVRAASDIIELKQMIKRKNKETYVLAKIEKPQAITNIDEIIYESDAIMVARGDLGVEIEFQKVPLLQKMIVEKCIKKSIPVIIATQMMESMITNFNPTRAEANDVANAVIDGADTLMLSGETSIGKYPVEAIKNMHEIIQYTENNKYNFNTGNSPNPESNRFIRDSICYSASRMAQKIGAKAIITFTDKGNTAFTICGYRPEADIFAFTKHKNLISVLSLLWGVEAFYFNKSYNINEAIDYTIDVLKQKGYLKKNDYVIHVGSTPRQVTHKTNMFKVTKI